MRSAAALLNKPHTYGIDIQQLLLLLTILKANSCLKFKRFVSSKRIPAGMLMHVSAMTGGIGGRWLMTEGGKEMGLGEMPTERGERG